MLRLLDLNAQRRGLGDGMEVEKETEEPNGESAFGPEPISVSLCNELASGDLALNDSRLKRRRCC